MPDPRTVARYGRFADQEASVSDPQRLRAQADGILELHEAERFPEALTACGELLQAAQAYDVGDEVVRESVFTARFERGVLLTELGDLAAAATAYGEAADTPTDVDDPDQRHELAMALLNQGICLDALDDAEGALAVYDQLVVRLGDADDPVTADQVVRGRVNRAAALRALGRWHEALTVAEALQAELDPHDVLEAEQLTMAARLRAAALRELGRQPEAVDVLAEVSACSEEEPATRAQVAAALGERAEALVDLGREREAIDVLEGATDRYLDDADPRVAEVAHDLLRTEAEVLEGLGDHERAATLRERVHA